MRRNHLHAVLLQFVVQRFAVIDLVANQALRLGLNHVEVETELHQRHFVMVGRVRAHRQRQPEAIHNRQDLHPLATPGLHEHLAGYDSQTGTSFDRPELMIRMLIIDYTCMMRLRTPAPVPCAPESSVFENLQWAPVVQAAVRVEPQRVFELVNLC